MSNFDIFYKQYSSIIDNIEKPDSAFTTNLVQYGLTEEYYNKVNSATELLRSFYANKLENPIIRNAISYKLNDYHSINVKLCLLIDVYRCYDGLNHPTSVSTPEGFALMLLLDKIIGKGELIHYGQLEKVSSTFISLLDLIPYISECSESLGARYSLFLPTIIGKKKPEVEVTYRKLIYNLCKAIVEVDGLISISEKEWLNEIALLNDDDPTNDIDIKDL